MSEPVKSFAISQPFGFVAERLPLIDDARHSPQKDCAARMESNIKTEKCWLRLGWIIIYYCFEARFVETCVRVFVIRPHSPNLKIRGAMGTQPML